MDRLRDHPIFYFLIVAIVAGYFGGAISLTSVKADVLKTNVNTNVSFPINNKVIRAEKFELIDKNGVTIGRLFSYNGNPYIALYDSSGSSRGEFSVVNNEPRFILFDANEKGRAAFYMTEGEPQLITWNSSGKEERRLDINGLPKIAVEKANSH